MSVDKIILKKVGNTQLQLYNKLTAESGQNSSNHRQIRTHSEEANLRNIFPTHSGDRARGSFLK